MATVMQNISNWFGDDDTVDSLRGLFIAELKDIYWAENKLVDTLPDMADAATTSELREAFLSHLDETRGQVQRLQQVFGLINHPVESEVCEAMKGLTEEGHELIESTQEGSLTRDAALIIAAQKVEHYEIATYGSLRSLAELLGYREAATLLQATLNEEGAADHKLTDIAESFINERAKMEGQTA
jgi:ferritin-like metal-binding protein YciE